MSRYVVYRHGSNAANQSLTLVAPIALVEARDAAEATELAARQHTVYANQHLTARPAGRVARRVVDRLREADDPDTTWGRTVIGVNSRAQDA